MPVAVTRGIPLIAVTTGQDSDPPPTPGRGAVNRTGLTADIASTILVDSPPTGLYEVRAIVETTIAGSGTATLAVNWTSEGGAGGPLTVVSKSMTAIGRSSGVTQPFVASGNITWTVTGVTGGTYAVRMRCLYLGA